MLTRGTHLARESTLDEIYSCRIPIWEFEQKASVDKTLRDHATALENEFCVGFHKRGANFNHPPGCRQPYAFSQCRAQCRHELALCQRVRCGQIHWSMNVMPFDEKLDGTHEILLMNPGNKLAAASDRAT